MASKKRSHSEEEEEYEEEFEPESDDSAVKSVAKPFGRFWSEDQVLAILNGVIKFSAAKRIDFASNMEEFYAFMKNYLVGSFTKSQLASKLQKLRRKFKGNLRQRKAISSLHENKVFQLSKRIWGAGSEVYSFIDGSSCPCLNVIEEGMNKVVETGRKRLDKKWKELEVFQLEINMKKAQLVKYQIHTTFDAFASAPVGGTTSLKIIGEGMDLVAETRKPEFDKQWKEIDILQLELNMKKARLSQEHTRMILDAYHSE